MLKLLLRESFRGWVNGHRLAWEFKALLPGMVVGYLLTPFFYHVLVTHTMRLILAAVLYYLVLAAIQGRILCRLFQTEKFSVRFMELSLPNGALTFVEELDKLEHQRASDTCEH